MRSGRCACSSPRRDEREGAVASVRSCEPQIDDRVAATYRGLLRRRRAGRVVDKQRIIFHVVEIEGVRSRQVRGDDAELLIEALQDNEAAPAGDSVGLGLLVAPGRHADKGMRPYVGLRRPLQIQRVVEQPRARVAYKGVLDRDVTVRRRDDFICHAAGLRSTARRRRTARSPLVMAQPVKLARVTATAVTVTCRMPGSLFRSVLRSFELVRMTRRSARSKRRPARRTADDDEGGHGDAPHPVNDIHDGAPQDLRKWMGHRGEHRSALVAVAAVVRAEAAAEPRLHRSPIVVTPDARRRQAPGSPRLRSDRRRSGARRDAPGPA